MKFQGLLVKPTCSHQTSDVTLSTVQEYKRKNIFILFLLCTDIKRTGYYSLSNFVRSIR